MASEEVLSALETLHRELEKLEPAIKHVEATQLVTEMVKDIPKKHVELLDQVKINDEKLKDALTKIFSKEISGLTSENKQLQKTTDEIQHQVKLEQEALAKMREIVQSFYERIEKINFPERLDKLDTNIAGIMAAIQSVQSRIDGLERNLTDRLKDILDYQKETRTALLSGIEQSEKSLANKQRTLTYITWGFVVIASLITLLLTV